MLGILVLVIIYVSVLVALIINSANRLNKNSVLFRILTNYFQVVLLVKNLDVKWPDRVEQMLGLLSFVSSASEDLLQISCLF